MPINMLIKVPFDLFCQHYSPIIVKNGQSDPHLDPLEVPIFWNQCSIPWLQSTSYLKITNSYATDRRAGVARLVNSNINCLVWYEPNKIKTLYWDHCCFCYTSICHRQWHPLIIMITYALTQLNIKSGL